MRGHSFMNDTPINCFGCEAREDALRVVRAENRLLSTLLRTALAIQRETSTKMWRLASAVESGPVEIENSQAAKFVLKIDGDPAK